MGRASFRLARWLQVDDVLRRTIGQDWEVRGVMPGWDNDPDAVRGALLVVELGQPFAKPMHLDPDDRILTFFEVLAFTEDIERNRVLTNLLAPIHHGGATDVPQQLRQTG